MSLEHCYYPIEILTKNQNHITQNEQRYLSEFIIKFRANPNAETIVVSNPFKQVISNLCDVLDPSAKQMNTVNLIVKKGKVLIGSNIDGEAFYTGQKEIINFDFLQKRILLLGCGGVSTAVAFKLAQIGVSAIYFFDTKTKKVLNLAEKLQTNFPGIQIIGLTKIDNQLISQVDVVYNGTGIGKISNNPNSINESPLPDSLLIPKNILAIDANYTPWKTKFLQQFEKSGSHTLNGFSHMIAFTSLHLSEVLSTEVPFSKIMEIGKKQLGKDIQQI